MPEHIYENVTAVEYESNLFPVSHWRRLSGFAVGDERDPLGLFRLTDDMWEAWQYAKNGVPSNACLFRFHFSRFQTFLKLYAKWYCLQVLLERPRDLRSHHAGLPAQLMYADSYIAERGFRSVDDISVSQVFGALWKAQIKKPYENTIPCPRSAVFTQVATRSFWQRLIVEFDVGILVPPTAPYLKRKPAEFAADMSKLIPEHVIKRLTNKLGLHRDGHEVLSRFDHLRLCVLMLEICLGRRMQEVLLAPRGEGPKGPLRRYPSRRAASEGALWFQFTPNKHGPKDQVFISPKWEDIALYCVHELIKYGDEVRHLAPPEERGLLVLVSRANTTKGEHVKSASGAAYGLTYVNFNQWLNGTWKRKGVLTRWGITANGAEDGSVYRLRTSYSRHTRQSALVLDPKISSQARQQDLNHQDRDMQFAYQHRLRENNDALLEKIKEGKLIGRGVEWLSELFGIDLLAMAPQPCYMPGRPSPMSPRMQALVRNNPLFVRQNRVPCGVCVLPQGPGGCAEFLNCTSAGKGGCHFFVVDVGNPQMLHELRVKASEERRQQLESASSGRLVQAQKRAVTAGRTEDLRDEAIRRATQETLDDLREIQKTIDEGGL
jgi:hypothetical protein